MHAGQIFLNVQSLERLHWGKYTRKINSYLTTEQGGRNSYSFSPGPLPLIIPVAKHESHKDTVEFPKTGAVKVRLDIYRRKSNNLKRKIKKSQLAESTGERRESEAVNPSGAEQRIGFLVEFSSNPRHKPSGSPLGCESAVSWCCCRSHSVTDGWSARHPPSPLYTQSASWPTPTQEIDNKHLSHALMSPP